MLEATRPIEIPATRTLAEFGSQLQWEQIPSEVIAHAKLCVLDAIGCCLFGSTLPWTKILTDTIVEQGGKPDASIWGTGHLTSVAQAAMVNCAAGHSFELDDLHTAALIHATTLSVPVGMAFSERDGASGREFLLACIAGFEIGLRVGIAGTHGLFHRGFHPQGASGVFAAAGTAARMLRFGADKTQHTLGIAASMASGLMAAQEGAMVKRLNSGHAGYAGAMAALLASGGYTGILNAIEAPYGGFLATYSDDPEQELVVRGLGSQWETLAIGFKAFPTVSCIHGPLKILREIMTERNLQAKDIARIDVACGTFSYRHTVWPYQASGLTEAQMNLYYGLSTMAVEGKVFVDQFSNDRLSNPEIIEFSKRIFVEIDPTIDALGPACRDAVRVTVATSDGQNVTREKRWRPGSPEDPMTPDDLKSKFLRLADGRWPAEKSYRLIALIEELDALPSIAAIAECLRT
jgi:2-methylcitrate dehydratase PrpD